MLEVRVNFPLDDNEIERIFNALRLKHDTTHSMVFGKYYDDDFMLDEKTVGDNRLPEGFCQRLTGF